MTLNRRRTTTPVNRLFRALRSNAVSTQLTLTATAAISARPCVFIHREAEKNHISFTNKSFNTQCNLTKFSTLIVNIEYYRRCYLFFSGIYTNFRRLLCKKCDVGYYVINHGVMKLMITSQSL